jgi:hypothetical protein
VSRRAIPAAAILALILCSCGNGALSQARQACSLVHKSIQAYEAGTQASDRAVRARDLRQATIDLQNAEPIAASATSADGQWNALMTTLNELGQVSEGHLVSALRAQCSVVNSNPSNF